MKYEKSFSDLRAAERNLAWAVQESLSTRGVTLTRTGEFIVGLCVGVVLTCAVIFLIGVSL